MPPKYHIRAALFTAGKMVVSFTTINETMPTRPSMKALATKMLSEHGPTIAHVDRFDTSWSACDLAKEMNKSQVLLLYDEVSKVVGVEAYMKKKVEHEEALKKKELNYRATSLLDDVKGVKKGRRGRQMWMAEKNDG